MYSSKRHSDQAENLRNIAAMELRKPRIITVASGKGGVGKSVIALNLAMLLARSGTRILLFDGDTNLGGLDILLGVSPQNRIMDFLYGKKGLNEIIISPFPNLSVLPANSGDSGIPNFAAREQDFLLKHVMFFDDPFEVIIIDNAAGISDEVIHYSILSDETIVVTTPEPTAILDAYALIKMICLRKKSHKIKVIINQAASATHAQDAVFKLQKSADHFLGKDLEYIGYLPFDKRVMASVENQIPIIESYSKSAFVNALQELASLNFAGTKAQNERSMATL